jgi:hypothetical protein
MPYRDHPTVQLGAAWFREYPQIVRIATEKKGCQVFGLEDGSGSG